MSEQRARIVVVGGEKGGTGKTTTAVNLAALLAEKGRDVLIVDTDPQMSASDWVALRDSHHPEKRRVAAVHKRGPGLARELIDLSKRYQEIIVDAGGRDDKEQRSAMLVADVMVSPMQASSFDIWTLDKLKAVMEECDVARNPDAPKLRVIMVINRADTNPNIQDVHTAIEYIEETFRGVDNFCLAKHPLRNRKAFSRSAAEGLGAIESDASDEKAEFEIRSLFKEVYGE